MSFDEKQLGQAQIAAGAQTTLYTVPGATVGIVRDIQIANVNAAARTIQVWLVPNGDVPDDGNVIIPDMTVDGNDIIHWSGWQVLETPGDTVQAEASVALSICITVGGAEIT